MRAGGITISLIFLGSTAASALGSQYVDEGLEFAGRCMKHCGTFSKVGDVVHSINCSISMGADQIGQPETCLGVERKSQGKSSKAVHVTKDVDWYTYKENSEMKLALNFSWTPGQDSSITSLVNYYVTVTPLDEDFVDLTSFERCFSIHTTLHETYHKNAEFYYDCYGIDGDTNVMPGKSYYVSIQSMPGKAIEGFKVDIPRCSDERLSSVTYCVENKKPLSGIVEKVFCSNRTIKYSYNVPAAFGDFASVALCESWPNYFHFCKNILLELKGLQPYGTLYNLSVDSSANLSIEYSVYVEGSEAVWQNYSKVDFSVCPPPTLPLPAITIALTSVALAAILSVAILVLIYCIFRDKIPCWKSSKNVSDKSEVMTDDVPLLRSGVTVYVVFDENDDLHVNVVHAFCRFLMADLGFKVINHLWEQNIAAQNSTRYMIENFQTADKVLIICSKGMREVLSNNDDWKNMYSGVINQAVTQVFGRYPDKCLLAYFDYSSSNDVPKEFPDSKRRYKLAAELNELFFALNDEEQIRCGRKLRVSKIEDFHDPNKRTQNAEGLCNAIAIMKESCDSET